MEKAATGIRVKKSGRLAGDVRRAKTAKKRALGVRLEVADEFAEAAR